MSTEFLTRLVWTGACFVALVLSALTSNAQDTIVGPKQDSLQIAVPPLDDDTAKSGPSVTPKKDFELEGPVYYEARDSIIMDLKSRKAYLYGNTGDASIKYQDMQVKAAYIEIDFTVKRLDASWILDSLGKEIGRPVFTQGTQEFKARSMSYNFDSKKGLIKDVITSEGEGFLHGATVKRDPDEDYYIKEGKYTTCNLEDPHFEIRFLRAKMTADKKIISGPAYLVIQHVPTPLFIPFGFFPAKKGRASGILIPTYGESANRGFFLENGGYYWGLSDHWDLALKGDIYSRGSWAVKTESRYGVRYKFDGRIGLSYATNVSGVKGTNEFEKNQDFRIEWTHVQSPKARPNSRFNASVIAGTSKFNENNPTNANDYLSNSFNSSIAYSTSIFRRLKLSTNLGMSQNTKTGIMTFNAPQLNLSSGRIYPFKPLVSVGKPRWYERISVNYTMDGKNTLTTYDSLFIFPDIIEDLKFGIKHNIPVNADFKILKHFNFNASFNYTERWYWSSIYRNSEVTTDVKGFKAARDFSTGTNLTTRIYGQLDIQKGPIAALRHVITPSAGLTYTPDFTTDRWGYFQYYLDENQRKHSYSIFEQGIYGAPPPGNSGIVNLGLSNNVEMKVRTHKDSIETLKKVKLIDNLSLTTAYNITADSLNWSPLTISLRTILFKQVNLTYTALYSLYARDEQGGFINQYAWKDGQGFIDLNNFVCTLSFGYSLKSKSSKSEKKIQSEESLAPEEREYLLSHLDEFIDFDNPWSLNLDYSFRYGETYMPSTNRFEKSVTHALNFNGNVSLTPKWKVGVRSGYDFISRDFTYTSIDVYRDLHCWEITFNWIPTGFQKSYNFTLRVKAQTLQDLKLTKKTDFRDIYY